MSLSVHTHEEVRPEQHKLCKDKISLVTKVADVIQTVLMTFELIGVKTGVLPGSENRK